MPISGGTGVTSAEVLALISANPAPIRPADYVLIAGTNAPAAVKAVAEYLCDGTADEVQINQALAVDDKRPIRLVGRFTTSAAITFADGIKHDLLGFNEDYAEIQANHTGNALELHSAQLPQEWRITIANLKITKGSGFIPARGISIQNGAFLTLRNVLVSHIDTGTALRGYFCNTNVFENCTVADSAIGVELTGAPDQASHLNSFRTCYFRANDVGLKITDRAHGNSWTGCSFDYTSTTDLAVQVIGTNESNGNTWTYCWFEGGNSSGALDLQGSSDYIFDRCRFAPDPNTSSIIKVSGFGTTGVVLIDPIVSNPVCLATLPTTVSVVKTGQPMTVDVTAFGAIADGVTGSAPAIQRAINHLGSTGGTVTGPVGTYLLHEQGSVNHDAQDPHYCLIINGESSTTDANGTHGPITLDFPSGTVFKLASSQGLKTCTLILNGSSVSRRSARTIIRGITFDGNWTAQTVGDEQVQTLSIYATNVLIHECTYQNFYALGIQIMRESRGVEIHHCYFDNTHARVENSGSAVRLEAQDISLHHCMFVTDAQAGSSLLALACNADIDSQGRHIRVTENLFAGGMNGPQVAVDGVTHCVIANNIFRDQCDTSGNCISLGVYTNQNGTWYESAHNVIVNNIFFNVRNGIVIATGGTTLLSTNIAGGCFNNIIANNIITRDFDGLRTQLDGSLDTYPDRSSPATGTVTAINLAIGIQEVGADKASGTATGGTATTLVDSTKTMGTTAYVNYQLVITGGTGKGQVRQISSHTNTAFTVNNAWDVTPDATSTYRVTANTGYNQITGNVIHGTNSTSKGIQSTAWLPSTFIDNRMYVTLAANAFLFGTAANSPNAIYRGNKGYGSNGPGVASPGAHVVYQDENSGTASITSAATTVTVTHKLGRTPTAEQIMIWPTTTLGTAARFWATNITSTTFDINVDAAPGATVTFGWRVFGTA